MINLALLALDVYLVFSMLPENSVRSTVLGVLVIAGAVIAAIRYLWKSWKRIANKK